MKDYKYVKKTLVDMFYNTLDKQRYSEICADTLEAVNKQISKRAKKSESGMYFICPCCDRFIERRERTHGNFDIPYCKWCGQKIDWGVTL